MKIDKMTLGTKIYVSQAATGGLLLLLGVSVMVSLNSIEGRLKRIVDVDSQKLELSANLAGAVTEGENAQRGMLLGALTGNDAELRTSSSNLKRAADSLQRSLRELEPLLTSDEARRMYSAMKSSTDEWMRQVSVFQEDISGQRFDQATKLQADVFTPIMERMHAESISLRNLVRSQMQETAVGAASLTSFVNWFTLALCLISTTVTLAVFWVVRNANSSLRRIAGELAEGSRQVASAAHQVSSSSQALAQGASEQAATLQETSASTQEINSMTQKNAENASTAAGEMDKADLLLKETDQKLGQMIGSMKEINTSSEKISKIIRVIDEIAFQTNILALNAAVEAARAGEAGMGFAVVADEVRNLAQRCAQAAKDTSDLIEESIVRSNEGKLRLDEVAASITRVFESASRMRLVANEVHVGSQEQARGIEQIARAITQMQQVTQSTAASAEEGASAGEEMSAQAQTLQDSVEHLRELVGAGTEARSLHSARLRMGGARPGALPPVMTAPFAPPTSKPGARIPLEGDFQEF